ncbi:MAG: amino acid ABC transporter substrate-binding protein [Methylocystis sp.]|uniref:amino acid ABC transporter substrate-binding protein n=1 Tax=Methylocystis sp. TaxID=1911079 RepID=UPI003DA26434
MKRLQHLCAALCFLLLGSAATAQAGTLKTVKDRGILNCGVPDNVRGFATVDENGKWTGFSVDFCRAISVAIFGDPAKKVNFVPVAVSDRFTALDSRKIDVLSSNATWTLSRESQNRIAFTGTNYFDEQGFLAPKSRKLKSPLELSGSKVCLETGTTSEANFAEWAADRQIAFEAFRAPLLKDLIKAYEEGRCDVLTSDISQLYAERLALAKPGDHEVLSYTISQEPISPAVRQDDPQWFQIVRWVSFAMIDAEALQLSQLNIDAARQSRKQDLRRFVGAEGDMGKQLGLGPEWAFNIVKHVGNYEETLERNLGEKSELGIKRSLNRLVKDGGILFAPPIR